MNVAKCLDILRKRVTWFRQSGQKPQRLCFLYPGLTRLFFFFLRSSQNVQQQIAHKCLIYDQVNLTIRPNTYCIIPVGYERQASIKIQAISSFLKVKKLKQLYYLYDNHSSFICGCFPLWPSEKQWHSFTAALIKYYYCGASLTIERGEKKRQLHCPEEIQ